MEHWSYFNNGMFISMNLMKLAGWRIENDTQIDNDGTNGWHNKANYRILVKCSYVAQWQEYVRVEPKIRQITILISFRDQSSCSVICNFCQLCTVRSHQQREFPSGVFHEIREPRREITALVYTRALRWDTRSLLTHASTRRVGAEQKAIPNAPTAARGLDLH
jgi:hypothetical protein